VVTWKEYPTPFELVFDRFAIIAGSFVLIGLCVSLYLAMRTDFVIGRKHGYVVLGLYVVYLVVCGSVALASK
jgi:Ca2+/Na+ antiporter